MTYNEIKKAMTQLVEALEMLRDEQNGAPLIRHEKAWREAMDKTEKALAMAKEK